MKFLKNLFSFTVPLVIVLSIFSLYLAINSVVSNYKQKINNDYSIMIVCATPIVKDELKYIGGIKIKDIELLRRDTIINKFKDKLSTTSLTLLEQRLPHFYNIYLKTYPTTSQLAVIKTELKNIANIKRIETFSSNHGQIYSLLVLCENIVTVLFLFFLVSSVLLLSKQITIWFFEHSKRISIMEFHGSSIFYSAMPMVRLSIISMILSSALVIAMNYFIVNNLALFVNSEIMNIVAGMSLSINAIYVVLVALLVSVVSIASVIIKHKIK